MGCRWWGFRRADGSGRMFGQQLEVAHFSIQDDREKKLLPFSVHRFSSSTCRDEYRSHLEKMLQNQPYHADMSTEEKWNVLKTCIVSTAENTIGRGIVLHVHVII